MFQVGFDVEAEIVSAVDGYFYLQQNIDLVVSLEKLFSTDLFSKKYLKSIRDIDFRKMYLATYKPNIKGRVKVMHFVGDSQVFVYINLIINYFRVYIIKLLNTWII